MSGRPPSPQEREHKLRRALEFIRNAFHRRPTVPEIARAGKMSPFHFHRVFKARYGESAFEMVARLQVERAQELMLRGMPLAEVAERVGYNSQGHFCMRFKQATGATPAQWLRQNVRAGGNGRAGSNGRNGRARHQRRRVARRASALLSWVLSAIAWQAGWADACLAWTA